MKDAFQRFVLSLPAVAVAGLLLADSAAAVPSYSRQTDMACNACHTTFPQLTPFGRQFKLTGYTISAQKEITSSDAKSAPLQLSGTVPLALMIQASFTTTQEHQPGTQNNDVELPQQLSLFLSGKIAESVGSFLQVTYTSADDHFSLDHTDLRFARSTELGGKDLIYGLTLNNAPMGEDLWNSTPMWGFPWAASDTAPTPSAAALVAGGLDQQVAGLGAYGLWNNHLYAVATAYRSEHIGGDQPPDRTSEKTIKGIAPYWRLAWQDTWGPNYLEVGTYGLQASLYPKGVSGATDKFSDFGLDVQYERSLGDDLLALRSTYLYEEQDLDATFQTGGSTNRTHKLHTFRLDGTYNRTNRVAYSLGYFLVRGDEDKGLYSAGEVTGSASGSPDSEGLIAELAVFPWQNVRLSAEYTAYLQFNGRSHDYDGSGRDAADNNTLYGSVWLLW